MIQAIFVSKKSVNQIQLVHWRYWSVYWNIGFKSGQLAFFKHSTANMWYIMACMSDVMIVIFGDYGRNIVILKSIEKAP